MHSPPRSRARSRALGIVACLALALLGPVAASSEPREESEPELILPGGHVVRPGQWIELRWTQSDEISELEILLSVDGGRHYAICISPQLDPERCSFVWRVPETRGDELRMRIRFNRGGREIEGAPTTPLRVVAGGAARPEPLGLPAGGAAGSADGREPRPPRGQGQKPAEQSVLEALESSDETIAHWPSASLRANHRHECAAGAASLSASCLAPFAAWRSVPLRT